MKLFLFVVSSLLCGNYLLAQDYLSAENTHNISNKAEMGYLAEVETNDETKEISLYFVTKTKNKKIKVEKYLFDYDLQFKDSEKLEYDRPADVKSRFSWFNFSNKEVEVVTGVTMEPDMFGKPVFKKKEITKSWSWLNGRYQTSIKTLDKLKPRGEDGKLCVRTFFDNDAQGTVIAVVGEQANNREYIQPYMDMSVMVADGNLNVVSNEPLKFERHISPYFREHSNPTSAQASSMRATISLYLHLWAKGYPRN